MPGQPDAAEGATVAATIELGKEFTALDEVFVVMDEVMVPYKETESKFYNTYTNTRKMDYTGVRHMSIRGRVTDAEDGALVPKGMATATAPDGSIVHVNISKLANYRIFSLAAGSYVLTIESPGYVTQEIANVVVNPEGITTLDIQLVKE